MYPGLVFILWMATLELNADCRIIDLTHPLSTETIFWPGFPRFSRTTVLAQVNEQNGIGLSDLLCPTAKSQRILNTRNVHAAPPMLSPLPETAARPIYYPRTRAWSMIEAGAFSTGEHGGTHIDAPRHFNRKGFDLNDLPIDLTIADGVMIDVKDEADKNHDYALTVRKILEWEKQHGAIPTAAAVIVNSGWSSRWPDPRQFFNTNATTNHSTFHYPIVSKEAAQWLVTHRKLKMLGLDVTGPDSPRDFTMPVHVLLLSKNIIIMENMLIPDTLPARGFRVHAAPIKIVGGTGVQTRIYAMLYPEKASSSVKLQSHVVYLLVLWLCLHIYTRYLHR